MRNKVERIKTHSTACAIGRVMHRIECILMQFKFRIRRFTLYDLRSTLYAGGTMRGASLQLRGSLTPHATRPECSCVKLTPVLARVTARLTAAKKLGRTRGARNQIADILGGQASSEVAHSHGMYRRSSTKAATDPGLRCDRRGLSHSVDPHTMIYRWTLLSRSTLVAQRSPLCYQARGLQLGTLQSSEP